MRMTARDQPLQSVPAARPCWRGDWI